MNNFRWYAILSILLIITSITIYLIQILIFRKIEDTLFYFFQDLAFIPIQVLLVMILIDKLLQRKEKQALFNKLNMVIGVFFNEVGNELIEIFISLDKNIFLFRNELLISDKWNDSTFSSRNKYLQSFKYEIELNKENLEKLRNFLYMKRGSMLILLENPNLLEHETFTDLLWSVFHLTDELLHRVYLEDLPYADIEHVKKDVIRAYNLLVSEWLRYMNHLKNNYPYLFSLAVRTNPFDLNSNAVIS